MKYDIEKLRQVLEQKYLIPAKKSGYICPICNNGTGKDGTGIVSKDGIHFTCFKGCFSNADIIDIVAIAENIPEDRKIKELSERYGITADSNYIAPKQKQIRVEKQAEQADTKQIDAYRNLFNQAKQNRNKAIEYLQSRGISKEYAEALNNIGYYHFTKDIAKQVKASFDFYDAEDKTNNVFIVEYAENCYMQRFINRSGGYKNLNPKGIKTNIYNADILKSAEVVFVVEGFFDSLSINSLGYNAIALNSTSNKNKLFDYIEKNKAEIKATIIVCLDTDETGIKTATEIKRELEKMNVECFNKSKELLAYTGTETIKDANELLIKDKNRLKANIENAIVEVKEEKEEEFETKKREWEKDKILNYIPTFMKEIKERKDNCIKTGYKQLDKILDGGLYAGLYIIGAISSLGKTSFVLQLAEQIAKQEHQVLFFSLEMSKTELIARSISRITYQTTNIINYPKSTREILRFSNYQNYSDAEQVHIFNSISKYEDYAGNINIVDGMGNIGTEIIRQKIKDYIYFTGKAPVIFIDYLQLLNQPMNIEYSLTDKQIIDKNIVELKRISRDYNIPVVAISSFNRDNYKRTAGMQSFKESGAIEYSSDILISLEYKALEEKEEKKDILDIVKEEYKEKGYNEILLKVIKNRNGIKDNVIYKTNGKYNIFEEVESPLKYAEE